LKALGIKLDYPEETKLTLEEFTIELKELQYSPSPRSKKLLVSTLHPDIRFRVKKRIVNLETRFKEKGKKSGWMRVHSYSVKDELWKALRIAEIVVIWAELGDE
jgi:hypothetical protein